MPNLLTIVDLLVLAGYAWAIVDALVRPAGAFAWAETMSRVAWLALLAVGFVARAGLLPLGIGGGPFINLVLVIIVVYYLGPIRSRMSTFPRHRRREKGSW